MGMPALGTKQTGWCEVENIHYQDAKSEDFAIAVNKKPGRIHEMAGTGARTALSARIKSIAPSSRVIMLTVFDDHDKISRRSAPEPLLICSKRRQWKNHRISPRGAQWRSPDDAARGALGSGHVHAHRAAAQGLRLAHAGAKKSWS